MSPGDSQPRRFLAKHFSSSTCQQLDFSQTEKKTGGSEGTAEDLSWQVEHLLGCVNGSKSSDWIRLWLVITHVTKIACDLYLKCLIILQFEQCYTANYKLLIHVRYINANKKINNKPRHWYCMIIVLVKVCFFPFY